MTLSVEKQMNFVTKPLLESIDRVFKVASRAARKTLPTRESP